MAPPFRPRWLKELQRSKIIPLRYTFTLSNLSSDYGHIKEISSWSYVSSNKSFIDNEYLYLLENDTESRISSAIETASSRSNVVGYLIDKFDDELDKYKSNIAANVGMYNIIISRNLHNDPTIYSIYANPLMINWIEDNLKNILSMDVIDIAISKNLSRNPAAIHILEKYPWLIDWESLASNRNAVHLLKGRLKINKLLIKYVGSNPAAVWLFEKYKIDASCILSNVGAIRFIEKHIAKLISRRESVLDYFQAEILGNY
jgi:hypothetical protein